MNDTRNQFIRIATEYKYVFLAFANLTNLFSSFVRKNNINNILENFLKKISNSAEK